MSRTSALKLELLTKNVLYLTYQVDKILKILKEEHVNKELQEQTDKYFDEDGEARI